MNDSVTASDRESASRRAIHDEPGGKKAWVVTVMLLLFMMINFADKAVLGLSATSIQEEFGITNQQYGTISSAFFLFFSLSAALVGYLADKFNPKNVITVLIAIWAVSMIPVLGPAGFLVILISRVVLGAAEGPAFGVAQHVGMSWFEDKKRNLPAAVLGLGAPMGVVVASPILGWVIVTFGWRYAFGVMILISVVWAIAWMMVGKFGPVGSKLDTPAPAGDTTSAPAVAPEPAKISHWRLIGNGTWIGCALSSFAAYWALSLLVAWVPPYLENGLGYSRGSIGMLVTLPWIAMCASGVGMALAVQYLLRKGVSSRGARGVFPGIVILVGGVSTLVFVQVDTPWLALLLMAVGLGAPAACLTTSVTALSEITPANQRGFSLGMFVAFYSLSGVVAPYLTGVLVGKAADGVTTGYMTVFTTTGTIILFGAAASILLINPARELRTFAARAAKIDAAAV
ncbi:MFS transporter [Dietzia cinnamea]|uniref:MFS transporter n=1 Tax=Dietzia cinnamea TaxID=321318 RepID=UPI0021A2C4DF|nr:MFS transporter [Dietzia cinnamea]MCT2030976.1 MFS transporter [Dietzia cinnamea]